MLLLIIAMNGKCSAKNVSGEHKGCLSFYAMMGILDTLSILVLLVFCVLQGTIIMMIVPIVALLVVFFINYLYKKLWDDIDPPAPQDEDMLTKAEAILINRCDENFDRWNTKYFNLAQRIRKMTIYISHNMFFFPYTHFYGYEHFTNRSQDYYVKWTWNSKDCKKF